MGLTAAHLGFTVRSDQLVERILIPKFYDPDLAASEDHGRFDLILLRDLLLPGSDGSRLGTWVPREFHGSGGIPYVRTSDLAHWRIRPDYKKGVSADTYERFKRRCDVQASDILLVAHGSYLVGAVALVTDSDLPMLLQDHVFRLRVNPAVTSPYLVLAALSTSFVRRQVRSRQFSAEIIDKIGERHLGIRVPIPRNVELATRLAERARAVIDEQSLLRLQLAEIDRGVRGTYWPRASTRLGFELRTDALRDRILIPRYYDPDLEEALVTAAGDAPWKSIGDLAADGIIELSAGVEPGKLAYGTGPIPFVRTTDLAEGEVIKDPKHGVSEPIYERYARKGGLHAEDVLVVRDGSYLVGTSALVAADDLPALHCGGIVRLRVKKRDQVEPQTLLGLLNLTLVRRQFRAKQFTRDVIDTLGGRLQEVRLPWQGSRLFDLCKERMTELTARKARAKQEIGAIVGELEPEPPRSAIGRPGWSMR